MAAKSKLEEFAAQAGTTPFRFLVSQYYKHGSQSAMAKALTVSPSTVRLWLMEHNLEERTVLVQAVTGFQITKEGQLAIGKGK